MQCEARREERTGEFPLIRFTPIFLATMTGCSMACPSSSQLKKKQVIEPNPPASQGKQAEHEQQESDRDQQSPEEYIGEIPRESYEDNFPLREDFSKLMQGYREYFKRHIERAVREGLPRVAGVVPEQTHKPEETFYLCASLQRIFSNLIADMCLYTTERLSEVSKRKNLTELANPITVAFQRNAQQRWEAWMPLWITEGTTESRFLYAQCLEEARRVMADEFHALRPKLPHRSKFLGFKRYKEQDDFTHSIDCGTTEDPPSSFHRLPYQKLPKPSPVHPEKNKPPQKELFPGMDQPTRYQPALMRRKYG